MISREDLELFRYADDPAAALGLLQEALTAAPEEPAPAFAPSQTPTERSG
jgi:hypothetical protein